MGSLGGWEIFLIVLAVLVLFGAKKIPEMMRGMGQGVKEFKKAAREISEEADDLSASTTPPSKPTASSDSPDSPKSA